MSRKAVSLAFSNGTNVLRSQSAACRGRLSALASLLVAATPAMASLNPLHVAEGCQPDLDNNRHRFGGGGLNPLHVAEGCQPGEIVAYWCLVTGLNPLHVAEGCQPHSVSTQFCGCVSIRCMSRKAVSRPSTPRTARLVRYSIRCMSRKAVSRFFEDAQWARLEVSIRCMSRKAVSPKDVHLFLWATGSQSAACRGRLSARSHWPWARPPASQSAACRGRLSALTHGASTVRRTPVSIRCMSRKAVSLLRRNAFVKRHLQAEFPARLTDFWRENRTDHESSGRLFAFQP